MILKKEGASDKHLSIAISRTRFHVKFAIDSENTLKSLLTNVCQ